MPSLKSDMLNDASLNNDEIRDAVIDAASRQKVPEGFTVIETPVEEVPVETDDEDDDGLRDIEHPEDPWYWLSQSDEKIAGHKHTPAQDAVLELNSCGIDSRGYHFGTNSGYAHVETQAIRDAGARLKKILGKIKDQLETMSNYVDESDTYWKGSTADDFRESFHGGMKSFMMHMEEFSPMPRELIAYADRYEGVITEANRIAESIEDAEWEDV